jgi:secreted Zn-dependent insulinase-like peptidase
VAEFKEFVVAMKRDLYFLLLVVGNATEREAEDLSDSILNAMQRKKVTSKKIEPVSPEREVQRKGEPA